MRESISLILKCLVVVIENINRINTKKNKPTLHKKRYICPLPIRNVLT